MNDVSGPIELDGQECCPEFFVLALYIQLKCYNVYHTVHCWSWTTQIAALKHYMKNSKSHTTKTFQIQSKNNRKRQNPYPEYIYITAHFPGLTQSLQ